MMTSERYPLGRGKHAPQTSEPHRYPPGGRRRSYPPPDTDFPTVIAQVDEYLMAILECIIPDATGKTKPAVAREVAYIALWRTSEWLARHQYSQMIRQINMLDNRIVQKKKQLLLCKKQDRARIEKEMEDLTRAIEEMRANRLALNVNMKLLWTHNLEDHTPKNTEEGKDNA